MDAQRELAAAAAEARMRGELPKPSVVPDSSSAFWVPPPPPVKIPPASIFKKMQGGAGGMDVDDDLVSTVAGSDITLSTLATTRATAPTEVPTEVYPSTIAASSVGRVTSGRDEKKAREIAEMDPNVRRAMLMAGRKQLLSCAENEARCQKRKDAK
jgi:hypothetical protein